MPKLRDKDTEVETIKKRNSELKDLIKMLAVEVQQEHDQCTLKYNLEQVCAHKSNNLKVDCGDKMACFNGGAINL